MSQMQLQLWKIVLRPPGFELGSFGLRALPNELKGIPSSRVSSIQSKHAK